MVSKAYIPSLIAIGDVVPNGTKMVPNLVWLIFSLFSTTFSCNIFRLDQHRKILFSKSADFVIFSDITNKMADVSDILYISTALLLALAHLHLCILVLVLQSYFETKWKVWKFTCKLYIRKLINIFHYYCTSAWNAWSYLWEGHLMIQVSID